MNWKYMYNAWNFQDNYLIALKRHDLLPVSDRIYQGYTSYIPCIYQTCTIMMRRSLRLASQLSCPSALGSLGLGLP